jgi:UV radiation resistance-associated gene protein
MFNRPRCRDWTPLVTQQLRLRNLIKISGHNIQCDNTIKCSIYFTLHLTSMSAPFFTSDRLDPHANILWSEIDSPVLYKSASKSVCIRIWQHLQTKAEEDETELQLRRPSTKNHTGDKILFLWGVFFSGQLIFGRFFFSFCSSIFSISRTRPTGKCNRKTE